MSPGAKYFYFTVLSDIGAMCAQENNSNSGKEEIRVYLSICGTISHRRSSGMAYKAAQTKFGALLKFTPRVFHIAPSFKPWSLKIPINDGYHESLISDLCYL
ncbi:uncharacterized protein A4U43_C02F4470 [Asparagus officinalis]|uniref:Uncharacterized protein n=1 Tax=Asparagus officinalis TaxID=4686 RepID=A0A5P1FFT9_ASPOF|nr:uncharacterized protein A4U43_C02F4470 [Asparagus officinalis]